MPTHACTFSFGTLVDGYALGLSDPFVRLAVGGQKATSKICKKTLNPTFNEQFSFVVHSTDVSSKWMCFHSKMCTYTHVHIRNARPLANTLNE